MDTIQSWLEISLFSVGEYSLTVARLSSSILILVATVILARYLSQAAVQLVIRRSHVSENQLFTFSRLMSYLIFTVGLLMALSALGISFDKLALIAGALGVGVGFGLQNIVSNFMSGIIILFEKSLRIGDFIELDSGLLGEVRQINIRSTLIRTLDNADILVPNSELINRQLNNWTLGDDERRFSISFGVAYGSDAEKVRTLVLEKVRSMPSTLVRPDREPAVIMTGFGDSSLDFVLAVWVKGDLVRRPGLVKSDYLLAILEVLNTNGIEIPFPQRDLHLKSAEPLKGLAGIQAASDSVEGGGH